MIIGIFNQLGFVETRILNQIKEFLVVRYYFTDGIGHEPKIYKAANARYSDLNQVQHD